MRAKKEQQTKGKQESQQVKKPCVTQGEMEEIWRQPRKKINWDCSTVSSTSEHNRTDEESSGASEATSPASEESQVTVVASPAPTESPVFTPGSPSAFTDDSEDMHKGMAEEFKAVLRGKKGFTYRPRKLETSEPWKVSCNNRFSALDEDTLDGTEDSKEPEKPSRQPEKSPQVKRPRGKKTRGGIREQERRQLLRQQSAEIDELARQVESVTIRKEAGTAQNLRQQDAKVDGLVRQNEIVRDTDQKASTTASRTPSPPSEELTEEYYEQISKEFREFFSKQNRIKDWAAASRKPSAQEAASGDSQRASTAANNSSQDQETNDSIEEPRAPSTTGGTQKVIPQAARPLVEGKTDEEIKQMIENMSAQEAADLLTEIGKEEPTVNPNPIRVTWDLDPRDRARYDAYEGDYRQPGNRRRIPINWDKDEDWRRANYMQQQKRNRAQTGFQGGSRGGPRWNEREVAFYEDGSVASVKRSVIQEVAPHLLAGERQRAQARHQAWRPRAEVPKAPRAYGQLGSPDYTLANRTDGAPRVCASQPPSAKKGPGSRRVPPRSWSNTPRKVTGTAWGPSEPPTAKRPGASGAGGGGGGKKNVDEEIKRDEERLFLRRHTGHKVFWNGNREYNETYELNTYFRRRNVAFGHPEYPQRIPAEYRERAEKAFNSIYGEGFTVMRAGQNGHPQEDRRAYTTKIFQEDKHVLEMVATRYDNSRRRNMTNREVEEMARYAESLVDEMKLRQALTKEPQAVYEAYDRATAANLLGGWGKKDTEESESESTRLAAAATDTEAEKRIDLLNQLSGLELPELRTAQGELVSHEIKDADYGQICYAVTQGMISGDIWDQVEEEVDRNEIHAAYSKTFDRMAPEGVRFALFGEGPASTDVSLDEDDYRKKLSHELRLLDTKTGRSIPIEGREENVPETYGMNYSQYVDRETDELRINAKDRLAVQKAYERLYAIVPRTQLWDYLFTGARLPNARKIRAIDGQWLMTETGHQTQHKGRVLKETYGTIEHQSREMKAPRSNIPNAHKGIVDEAYTRYTRGYKPEQIEQLIYGRVPPEAMEVDVQSSTASMAGRKGESAHGATDDPMDSDGGADEEAERLQHQQYQEDLNREEAAEAGNNGGDDGMDNGGEDDPGKQDGGTSGSKDGDKDGKKDGEKDGKKDDKDGDKNGKPKGRKTIWSSSDESSEQSISEESQGDGMEIEEESATKESHDAPKAPEEPQVIPQEEETVAPTEQPAQGEPAKPPQAAPSMVKKPIKPTSRTSAQGMAKFTPVETTAAASGTGRATLYGAGVRTGEMSPGGYIPLSTAPRGSGSSWAAQQRRQGGVGQRYFQPNCRNCGTQHGLNEPCPRGRQQRPQGGRGFNVSQEPRRPSSRGSQGGVFGQTMPARRPAQLPTQGADPRLGASTGGTKLGGAYALAAAKRTATSSIGSGPAPPVPPVPTVGQGYKAPTKRVQSVRGKKKEMPPLPIENDAPNGMAKMSFMAGNRVVPTEVTRHTANDGRTLTRHFLVYTVVYACCGMGIGWLDKANNREIIANNPDMDYPLLMQFGDRSAQGEVYFFTGEQRKVMSYATLRNERGELEPRQSMNDPLTSFIDATTGRLKPNTVCVFSALYKPAPSAIQKRIGIVHKHIAETGTGPLMKWRMEVCTTDGRKARPVMIANENISYGVHELMNTGDWCAVDGFKVHREFPNYSLGGCIFPYEVPGSVQAEEGYYPIRLSYTDRQIILESTPADWRSEDYTGFRMAHNAMSEASGAVLHWESVLTRERAERSSMPITKARKLEKGLYEFTVTTDELKEDELVAACAIKNMVKITEINNRGEKNIVMNGMVTATRFTKDLITMVTVRHVLTSKDEAENEREITGKAQKAPEDQAELGRYIGQLTRLAQGNEIRNDFFAKRIANKKLSITQSHPTAVVDSFLAMVPKLGSKTCPMGTGTRLGMINSIVNGYIIEQDDLVTAQMVDDELAQLKRSGPSPRRQELEFRRRWLNLLDTTDLDQEQLMVMKLAGVDYVPALNVVAPGGTGKTHVGMNIISCMLDRNRTLHKNQPWRIVVGVPNNSVAATIGEKLLALRNADVLGPYEAVVVQSTTQLMERNNEVSFSLVSKAKNILEKGWGSNRVKDLLQTFIQVVEENQQVHFNMAGVLQACMHYGEPCVVVSTWDMLARYPTLTKNCTQFIAEETSRDPDLKFRAVICRLEKLEQVILLGDPAQLPPYADIKEIVARSKFGMTSLAEQATKRGLMHTCTLVNNRRSVVQLVQCLKEMSEFYSNMVSMVETPDYQADPKFSMPPLVQADCPILLLHTTSKHRRTRAAMISNPTQDRGAIELVRVTERFQTVEGTKETNVLVAATYAGSKHYIESKLRSVAFARGTGVETVDGAQGKQASAVIYVTGRAGPPATGEDVPDFTKDPKRNVVGLGRAQHRVYIIGNFDYLTLDENSPIAKYILEATKYTPVVDLQWYVEAATDYVTELEKRVTQEDANEVYPEISTFGNGVLLHDFIGNTNPTKQDHIVDCNVNRFRGWKDRRNFEETVEAGYEPPTAGPFNIMTTLPTDTEVQRIATGMEAMGPSKAR